MKECETSSAFKHVSQQVLMIKQYIVENIRQADA